MFNSNYFNAVEKYIISPPKARYGCAFDKIVTAQSAKWQRGCFEIITTYQGMETKDGCKLDTSNHSWQYVEAWPIVDEYFDKRKGDLHEWMIGAVCFSVEREGTILQSCWIHPFHRNRGLLKKIWPSFEARYGKFKISSPVSRTMRNFLKTVNYDFNMGR